MGGTGRGTLKQCVMIKHVRTSQGMSGDPEAWDMWSGPWQQGCESWPSLSWWPRGARMITGGIQRAHPNSLPPREVCPQLLLPERSVWVRLFSAVVSMLRHCVCVCVGTGGRAAHQPQRIPYICCFSVLPFVLRKQTMQWLACTDHYFPAGVKASIPPTGPVKQGGGQCSHPSAVRDAHTHSQKIHAV